MQLGSYAWEMRDESLNDIYVIFMCKAEGA